MRQQRPVFSQTHEQVHLWREGVLHFQSVEQLSEEQLDNVVSAPESEQRSTKCEWDGNAGYREMTGFSGGGVEGHVDHFSLLQ